MAKEKKLTDAEARDLDETRRLLYMALMAPLTEKYSLAGTLVNALRHHQGLNDAGLEDHVVAAIEVGTEKWVRKQIRRCTDALDA